MAETVTVMFTDLVGSTELMVQVGEEAAEELRRGFFSLQRESFAPHGGREVKSLGDGLMIVFPSASAAVSAGAEMQRSLWTRNLRSAIPLAIRVGVSVGDADESDGDYYGIAVVEAARLCAAADGGQCLVTEAVRALARDRSGWAFEVLGDLDLKGLGAPLAALSVDWGVGLSAGIDLLPRRLERMASDAFVGRAVEISRISHAIEASSTLDRPRVVLVSGEPGVGKSTLVAHSARMVRDSGAILALGVCSEEVAAPFRPWREVFELLIDRMPDDVLREHVSASGIALATLVPALVERVGGRRPAVIEDPESERYALFAAAIDLFRRSSADAPLVVVLEDIHWADPATLALLRHLGKVGDQMPVTVVGTLRDADLPTGGPLDVAMLELHREGALVRIELSGLDDGALLELMARLAGGALPDEAGELRSELLAETDGNPFFVIEILRHLADNGSIRQEPGGNWTMSTDLLANGLPVSVRSMIVQRAARLGEEPFRLLRHAAVIGREFDLDLLERVAGSSPASVLDCVEAACASHLVDETNAGGFTFTHALVEHALYEEVSPTRRARIHRSVAESIEDRAGPETAAYAPTLVHHWVSAEAPGATEKIVRYACQAGEVALGELAPESALSWFELAQARLEGSGSSAPQLLCRALVGLGEAQWRVGEQSHSTTLASACRLAMELDDTGLRCAAGVAGFGSMPTIELPRPERVDVLEAAIDATAGEESVRRVQVLSVLSGALILKDVVRSRCLTEEAIAVARSLGDERELAWALVRASWAVNSPENRAVLASLVDEALVLSASVVDPTLRWHVHSIAMRRASSSGDTDERLQMLDVCTTIADQLGHPLLRFVATHQRAVSAIIAGRLEEGEAIATEAFAIASAAGLPDADATFAAQMANIRLMQGAALEIVDVIGQMSRDHTNVPAYRAAYAVCLVSLGQVAEARAVLAEDIGNGFAGFPMDPVWAVSMHLLAEAVAMMELPEAAETLAERIVPHADVVANSGPTCFGVLHHSLGELLTVLSRFDEAEEQYSSAEATYDRMSAPLFLARTRLSWARMLLRRNGPGDANRAQALVGAARSTAAQFQHEELRTKADEIGRAAGAGPSQ